MLPCSTFSGLVSSHHDPPSRSYTPLSTDRIMPRRVSDSTMPNRPGSARGSYERNRIHAALTDGLGADAGLQGERRRLVQRQVGGQPTEETGFTAANQLVKRAS